MMEIIKTFLKKSADLICSNTDIGVKIINKSDNPLPSYAKLGDSGMDIRFYSKYGRAIEIPPLGKDTLGTGLFVELPKGYEFQNRPKSGLASLEGIQAILGTIDEAYRGEIKVILYNSTKIPFKVSPGDKIAQLVLAKVPKVIWKEVDELSVTERGSGGFGHTGK